MKKADFLTIGKLPFIWMISALIFMSALFGISVYQDYGISWDEARQREIALLNYEYVVNGDEQLHQFRDKDYGVAIEMPLLAAEQVLGLEDCKDIYQMRHLLCHLFFILGCALLAMLVYRLFGMKSLALIAYLLLYCSPRFFGHSFVNSKDIPFMVGVIAFLNASQYYVDKRHLKSLVLLVLSAALIINLRIMGVLIIAPMGVLLIIEAIKKNHHASRKHFIYAILALPVLVILMWPYLWPNPSLKFYESINNMRAFRWNGDLLYLGETLDVHDKPWHYLPVWIGMTLSPTLLVLTISGLIYYCRVRIWRLKDVFKLNNHTALDLSAYLAIIVPIGAIITKADIFDGWRHMYFITPGFIILGMYFLFKLSKTAKTLRVVSNALVGTGLILTMFQMILIHPYQHVYFNQLVPKEDNKLFERMELDYWGTSYGEALRLLADKDRSPTIYIYAAHWPGKLNACSLEPNNRKRFEFVDSPGDANYLITTHRFKQLQNPEMLGKYALDYKEPVLSIKIYGNTLCDVYELRSTSRGFLPHSY